MGKSLATLIWLRIRAFALLVMLTAGAISLTGCQKVSVEKMLGVFEDIGIISTRQQSDTHTLALIKLKNPALLTSVKLDNGQKKIDKNLQDLIEQEQQSFLAALPAVTKDFKVIYKYKMVLNAVALVIPNSALDKVNQLTQVSKVEQASQFARPAVVTSAIKAIEISNLDKRNSVNFMGADLVHKLTRTNSKGASIQLDGTGMKVGIIDTGIDYTHSMMMGPGKTEDYESVDPSKPSALFPNKKVVGGIDLVGTDFDAGSDEFKKLVPNPDLNPLDEAGHGSHVAGSVAGIGDNLQTYSGVAPGADLYAIKVFGANGSTSDSVVIAALEYSADPTGNADPSNQLDVVNMSLGSSYGSPHSMYNEAIKNLTLGGTVVVASAGNSGNEDYIVGSPGVSDQAMSVAASVDHSEHNWLFSAVQFDTKSKGEILAELVESTMTPPVQEIAAVNGSLVFAGFADKDFAPELIAQLKGQVALIDRGAVAFTEKIRRAQAAGAIGVVVANNQPGDAFQMGGSEKYNIPAVMISQSVGDSLKESMKLGPVTISFKTTKKIEKSELLDTLTSFSSRGPRSIDSLIKPEISGPGLQIISAQVGGGAAGVKMSGTSMSSPHLAGAMTLLKQAFPNRTVEDLKAIMMNHGKIISDASKIKYPVSRQGAGRAQVLDAVNAQVLATPAAMSLGEINLATKKIVPVQLNLENLSDQKISYHVEFLNLHPGIKLVNSSFGELAAMSKKKVDLKISFDASAFKESIEELDGFIQIKDDSKLLAQIPILAVSRKTSLVKASELKVSSHKEDSAGALVELKLNNLGSNAGQAYLFNLLGTDARKKDSAKNPNLGRTCDLQSAGYRIVNINNKMTLQVAAKIFEPLTKWYSCELSLLIDKDGDQVADQELVGTVMGSLPGVAAAGMSLKPVTFLLDAALARKTRADFEDQIRSGSSDPKVDYKPAIVGVSNLTVYEHGTIMILEMPIDLLATKATGELSFKLATLNEDNYVIEMDDYLGMNKWHKISLKEDSQAFAGMPLVSDLKANENLTVEMKKGYGKEPLLILFPQNQIVFSDLMTDSQALVLKPSYQK